MLHKQQTKNENNSDFHYLGKRYRIVFTNQKEMIIGSSKVFMNKEQDLDKFYKKEAKRIYKEHLDTIYILL